MADFLVDTGVFIDHLRGAKRFVPKAHRIHYSFVTRAELLAGNTGSDVVQVLLAAFRELEARGRSPSAPDDSVGRPGYAATTTPSSTSRSSRSKTSKFPTGHR